MTPSQAVRAAVLAAVLMLALGAGVFTLRDASHSASVDAAGGDVRASKQSLDHVESDGPSPAVAPMPGALIESAADTDPELSGADEIPGDDWEAIDTGPFIDADDDSGDYMSGPVSDVGEFLDPDAG